MNSVIIPCYNSRATIKRLLDSIPEHLEVIIVEDGSTEPVDIYGRYIRLFHNVGVGHARNIGLSKATGEYVFFADSDDEFTPNAFDKFEPCLNHDVVYSVFYDETDKKYKISRPFGCVYATAYKRKFLINNGIWFPTTFRLVEDVTFNTIVYKMTTDTATLRDDTYIRHFNKNSITNQQNYMIKELPDRVKALVYMWRYFNGNDWTYEQISRSIAAIYWIYMWALPRMTEQQIKDFWDELGILEAETHFKSRMTDTKKNLKLTKTIEKRLTKIKKSMEFQDFINGIQAVF